MNKAELKRLALEVREEVGLDEHQPFDPRLLTELYGIPVQPLSDIACSSEALAHFSITRPEVFSGALVPLSTGNIIIENDSHDAERRKSTLCHEVSHVVLEHKFSTRLVSEMGCGATEPQQEKEAAHFSGELMIPFDAAMRMAFRNYTDEQVAQRHGVSLRVAAWRMNQSGARLIVRRTRQKQSAR